MTPDEAAALLDTELRPYPWFVAVGVGENEKRQPELVVYVKSLNHRKLTALGNCWHGFKLLVEHMGQVRPLGRTPATLKRAAG